MIQDYATTYRESVLVAPRTHACMHSKIISIIKDSQISKTFSGTFTANVLPQIFQGIMSRANLRKGVSSLGRGAKKISQTTIISNDEIPKSDLQASFIILSFFFLFV